MKNVLDGFFSAVQVTTSGFSPPHGLECGLQLSDTAISGYKLRVHNVLVTGGTGFIGSRLVSVLNDRGQSVSILGRDAGRIHRVFGGNARGIAWNPLESGSWTSELGVQNAVVHLAGEPAVGRRYSDALKQKVRDSRVKSTRRLVDALGLADSKPEVLICASAVGFYGSAPDGVQMDESSPAGNDFLAEVCHEWESAALRAELFGIRVVLARFGVVLGAGGGALSNLLPLFRFGLGGRLGSGDQPFSWISLQDAVAAIVFCLEHENIRGPVNVVSPNCVTNRQFTRDLANSVQRPALMRAPAWALRLVLGEGAYTLLEGQRAVPTVLTREGFEFRYPDLNLALAAAIAHM